ncbi:MAG: protein phosphatase 2C domain-containing protein [Gemmatimonadota bacterium]|nr:MAG: protein phosphatase 2C domain-containing protein [Gemmatimonadota bacterium]
MTTIENEPSTRALGRKPVDEQIDFHGLTHPGKVRTENQDHFLVSSLHKRMEVHLTSLPDTGRLYGDAERLALLAMVADGVGGGPGGEAASRLALEAVSQYAAESMDCYYTADPTDDHAFTRALANAALHCHQDVLKRSDGARGRGMATTLTLMLFVWPRAYLLQVGDSRYYILRDGELTQISRDQTLAQVLVDDGVFSRTEASKSPLSEVLSSAIGGSETTPVVTGIDQDWNYVHLLCSDGLTKHVSDERIAERLRSMTSAKQVCEDLLKDALDDGGSDNITVIVGRALRNDD